MPLVGKSAAGWSAPQETPGRLQRLRAGLFAAIDLLADFWAEEAGKAVCRRVLWGILSGWGPVWRDGTPFWRGTAASMTWDRLVPRHSDK